MRVEMSTFHVFFLKQLLQKKREEEEEKKTNNKLVVQTIVHNNSPPWYAHLGIKQSKQILIVTIFQKLSEQKSERERNAVCFIFVGIFPWI